MGGAESVEDGSTLFGGCSLGNPLFRWEGGILLGAPILLGTPYSVGNPPLVGLTVGVGVVGGDGEGLQQERPVCDAHRLGDCLVAEVHCLGCDLPVDAVPVGAVDAVGDLDDHFGCLLPVGCGPVAPVYVNIFGEDDYPVLAECGAYCVHYCVDAPEVESLRLVLAVLPYCLYGFHDLAECLVHCELFCHLSSFLGNPLFRWEPPILILGSYFVEATRDPTAMIALPIVAT